MLRECKEHGYFRAPECPICGEEGKFLMNQNELDHIGRTLAGVLRHFPEKFDLDMDDHGFVDLRAFISVLQRRERRLHWLRLHHLTAIIETDPKGRYQIKNEAMRATYGHSFDVDLDLPTHNIPDSLFYPASEEEAELLLETGLKPADRQMVHLSKDWEAAMEAGIHRMDEPVILEIDAAAARDQGIIIMEAGTTVYLTDEIPAEFLKMAEKPKGIEEAEEEEEAGEEEEKDSEEKEEGSEEEE